MIQKQNDAKDFLLSIQKSKDRENVLNQRLDSMIEDRKNILDLNIVVGLDISGSISTVEFSKFMSQLNAIKGLSRVKVIEVDTQIVSMYDYFKTGRSRIVKLSGGGGTAFGSAFAKMKEMKPDAILFMTDGEVSDHVSNPGIPTGWVLTRNGKKPYGFGQVVVTLD